MFFCVWTFIDYCILIVSLCDCHTRSIKATYLLTYFIWPFACLGGIWNPILGEGEVVGVSDGSAVFERAMVVSYRLSIVIRCTICNHSAAICDRMSPMLKSNGGGSLWAKMSGCSPWSRPLMFGSVESEHPKLTNRGIIFEEFQPM